MAEYDDPNDGFITFLKEDEGVPFNFQNSFVSSFQPYRSHNIIFSFRDEASITLDFDTKTITWSGMSEDEATLRFLEKCREMFKGI